MSGIETVPAAVALLSERFALSVADRSRHRPYPSRARLTDTMRAPSGPEAVLCRPYCAGGVGVRRSCATLFQAPTVWLPRALHIARSGKLRVRKALLEKLRILRASKWPTGAAIAASLLLVVALPPNSTVLVDQIVAAQLRAMVMLVSAWLHARAEAQEGVASMVLFPICRLLDATNCAATTHHIDSAFVDSHGREAAGTCEQALSP
jgi:hypothetical protein